MLSDSSLRSWSLTGNKPKTPSWTQKQWTSSCEEWQLRFQQQFSDMEHLTSSVLVEVRRNLLWCQNILVLVSGVMLWCVSLSAVASVSGESSGSELTQWSGIDQSVSVASLSERPDRSDETLQQMQPAQSHHTAEGSHLMSGVRDDDNWFHHSNIKALTTL